VFPTFSNTIYYLLFTIYYLYVCLYVSLHTKIWYMYCVFISLISIIITTINSTINSTITITIIITRHHEFPNFLFLLLLGLGYRAKFIVDSSKFIHASGSWLNDLRNPGLERLHVQEELQKLPGVGRKVADCIALFCLDQR
jgi:hypothetical protein